MYISEYSDADICRYVDDQMRFFGWDGRYSVVIYVRLLPFVLVLDLGSYNIEPSLNTKSISEYNSIFFRWEDAEENDIEPADDKRLQIFQWAKDFGPGYGKRFKLKDFC